MSSQAAGMNLVSTSSFTNIFNEQNHYENQIKHTENYRNSQAINIAIQHAVRIPVGTEQLYGKVPLQHSKMWPLSSEVKLFPLRRNSVM